MVKYNLVVADPPWNFSDRLRMSQVKRGAESQYPVLSDEDIRGLDIESIVADDAILVLWVPSSKIQAGLDVMQSWGFEQKQTFIWVKTKKQPLSNLIKNISFYYKKLCKFKRNNGDLPFKVVVEIIQEWDIHNILNFGLGRLFRQTHEIALVGIRGSAYNKLENHSQRSVLFDINIKHSAKPEGLQDRLDVMFPNKLLNKLELFARRERSGWRCVGNECKLTLGEDIRDSIEKLKAL